ncbi:MAG: hypothetical protein P8N66_00680, partial [Porticoccaceae bacterium]|nr:hypothetical protein [Porticoccaceae bacterium]
HISGQPYLLSLNAMLEAFYATKATALGAYVKQGKVFKMYTFDPTSSGKLNFATGTVDFVAKTMKFKVSEVDTSF